MGRNGPSKRNLDLLDKGGIRRVIWHYYNKHWTTLVDVFDRMGIDRGTDRDRCHFCKSKYNDILGTMSIKQDLMACLLNHIAWHMKHGVKERGNKHPFDHMLHILASLVSCFLSKGSYTHYELIRSLIRHDRWGTFTLLEGDWFGEMSKLDRIHTPKSLGSYCISAISKIFLEDMLFEYCAYLYWYDRYNTWKSRNCRVISFIPIKFTQNCHKGCTLQSIPACIP